MKKLVCLLLAAALLFALSACGNKNQGEPDDRRDPEGPNVPAEMLGDDAQLTGGWSAAEDPAVDEARRAVFDKAMDGLVGVDYLPFVYLGSQVVAGSNHAFLCQAKVVYPGAQPYFAIVYVYEALDGSCKILSIAPIAVNGETAVAAEPNSEAAAGAWTATDEFDILTDMQADFDKAMEGLTGVSYEPLACLATQVVAGVNYAFLCQAKTVAPGAQPYFAIVRFYAGVDGSRELLNIGSFDFGAFCTY